MMPSLKAKKFLNLLKLPDPSYKYSMCLIFVNSPLVTPARGRYRLFHFLPRSSPPSRGCQASKTNKAKQNKQQKQQSKATSKTNNKIKQQTKRQTRKQQTAIAKNEWQITTKWANKKRNKKISNSQPDRTSQAPCGLSGCIYLLFFTCCASLPLSSLVAVVCVAVPVCRLLLLAVCCVVLLLLAVLFCLPLLVVVACCLPACCVVV